MKYKCVVFDFDGTLANTEAQVFDIYNDLAKEYKFKEITKEEMSKIKGMHVKELMEFLDVKFYKIPRALRKGKKRLTEESDQIQPFKPHLMENFVEIDSMVEVCGILTSNIKRTVLAFTKNQGICDFFDFVLSSSLFSKEKKLKKICKKYKFDPLELLYVGDETRDIIACKKAGVDVVAVDWGYNFIDTLKECNPTYTVSSMEEIVEIVRKKNQ